MSNHIRRGSITLQNISFRQISTTSSLLQNAPESSSSSSSTINNRLNLPDSVNVIVVGGGIIGASVAYHLAKRGVQDVLLLERHKLTSGTTWHAAGLMVTFGSLSSTSTFMRKYSKELYSKILPEETGLDCGFKPVGFIELAADDDHYAYFKRVAAFNRFLGIDVQELTPTQVQDKFPLCDTDDVVAGFYVPTDGRVNPYDTTMALAKGARLYDVNIIEDCPVTQVLTLKRDDTSLIPTVTGVMTECGNIIHAKKAVVNCTGMWARQFGEMCGVTIPNQAAEHYYLITKPMASVQPDFPVIEDPSRYAYIRPEGGGLLVGLFEREGAPWNVDRIPNDFNFGEINPDWDRMMPYLEKAMSRVPETMNVEVSTFFCGPESFTPDNLPIVGQTPQLRNYYVAAGMNSIGILTGGGIGNVLAEWIDNGTTPKHADVTGINVNRFHRNQSNPLYRAKRVGESLGNTYKLHYPNHSNHTCRGVKRSPFHDRLKQRNAFFRDVSGWESPSWYAPNGLAPIVDKEGFGRESWFAYWKAEHEACRQDVTIFDMSFMAKLLVNGRDAGSFLNNLSTAQIDKECGKITYTQWLNEDGRMEADLTVIMMNEDTFMVVATDTMQNHVLMHMKHRIPAGASVTVTDVTGMYAQINLQGPKSRDLVSALTSHDVSNESFPFRSAAEIDIGLSRAWCARISYVGELGFELYIPAEYATYVYDEIVQQGQAYGLRHAGLKALGSLRLEKGYRDYGHDMDNTDTLLECGLDFTCDFTKPYGFIGAEHVLAQKNKAKTDGGLFKRMGQVLVTNPEPLLHHGEILWRNGTRVCEIRSASYGHTLGGAVGLAMLEADEPINKDFLQSGEWEVETPLGMYPCIVSLRPLYDPKNLKINK